MIGIIAMSIVLAVGTTPQKLDTTLTVEHGTSLRVGARSGSVVVDTWKRDQVRVVANRSADAVEVHYGGGEVNVETDWRSGSGDVDYHITVPEWMDMHVEAQRSDVRVDGAGGEVVASTIQGAIRVRGGRRFVSLNSVSGALEVSDARARVQAQTVNHGITLRNVTGDIDVQTVSGGISLSDVDSKSVRASTVNGGVSFHGAIQPSGFYHLSSHNGRVGLFLSRPPDATISVTAFNGTFDTDFPLRLTSTTGGGNMTFTLGSGSARVELSSFNGEVVLGRAGGPKDTK